MARKAKLHTIELRPRPGAGNKMSVGATTQVFLDGELLGGCRKISIVAEAKKITVVKLEMVGIVKAAVVGNPQVQVKTVEM